MLGDGSPAVANRKVVNATPHTDFGTQRHIHYLSPSMWRSHFYPTDQLSLACSHLFHAGRRTPLEEASQAGFRCPSCCLNNLGARPAIRAAELRANREGTSRRLRVPERRMTDMNSAHRDQVRLAVAARERGRSKVRSATTAVSLASVAAAGAVALVLPGSTHKADTSSSSSSAKSNSSSSGTSSAGSGTSGTSTGSGSSTGSGTSTGSSGFSSTSAPVSSSGSSQATSGGS